MEWRVNAMYWAELAARLVAGSVAIAYGAIGIYGVAVGRLDAWGLVFLVPLIAAGYFSVAAPPNEGNGDEL